jgi:hypothetical protein
MVLDWPPPDLTGRVTCGFYDKVTTQIPDEVYGLKSMKFLYCKSV